MCMRRMPAIQPTYVVDAARAILAALENPATRELQYDLGGPEVLLSKMNVFCSSENIIDSQDQQKQLTGPPLPI